MELEMHKITVQNVCLFIIYGWLAKTYHEDDYLQIYIMGKPKIIVTIQKPSRYHLSCLFCILPEISDLGGSVGLQSGLLKGRKRGSKTSICSQTQIKI